MSPVTVSRTLGELAVQFGCRLRGDPDTRVDSVASLDGGSSALGFVANRAYRDALRATQLAAVIVDDSLAADCPTAALLHDNPHATFARVAALLHPASPIVAGIHPTASVHPAAQIDASAQIDAFAVVGAQRRAQGDGPRRYEHRHRTIRGGHEDGGARRVLALARDGDAAREVRGKAAIVEVALALPDRFGPAHRVSPWNPPAGRCSTAGLRV